MSARYVVTGTDTGIGKTVFSAALTAALDGFYWKPIQSGLDDETDSQTVARLGGLAQNRILPELWRLRTPASPHIAAEIDGASIHPDAIDPPAVDGPLVIEGAGGLMVPLTPDRLFIEVFARWGHRVILCARTRLGTINHTLLSIEALRSRQIPVLGVAFIGEPEEHVEETIVHLGRVRRLGRMPFLTDPNPSTLARAFHDHFDLSIFEPESRP
ncbi:dethiobiotin synthetase [Ciceribacter lividus]|uniref:ATP-dependent dethiobiotin synthetase BioD n=1 Tax=Ciceribacter lividus TaxID=1197950 RepID=A0A6I7HLH6_9HYPH|nr:dethiobiotin synthase [Ciceribacter lividus]RCW23225.1 dethiobiotin synthetase [Ciceribacter lividus]